MCSSGATQGVQDKVSHYCVLPRVTWHELQSNLQMAATCVGLKFPRRGQAEKQLAINGQLPLMLGLGPVFERYGAH